MNKEIKQGYKQTKVGIIPEDWEVVKVGEKFDFLKTYSNSREDLNNVDEISYIHYGEIHTKHKFYIDFGKFELPKINKSKLPNEIIFAQNGDLVIADASEDYADIGKSAEIKNLTSKAVSGLHTFLLRDKNNNFVDGYKGYLLYNEIVARSIKKIATGISVLGISKTNLSKLEIPLPPLKEQEEIAEILTTWDEAITKQTELLEAKELQKKALMQKLLSGEVRFSGFSDEWEEIRLGKYIKEISKKNKENVELVLSVTNKHGFIAQKDYFEKEVASKDTSNYKIVKKGNFAYNPSRINVGSLGLLEEYEIGILSPMYVIFECLKGLDKQYLNYWLNTHNFTGNLSKFLSGSVRDSLAFNDMKLMKIKLPSLPEQQKIAEVLSLADDEINLLKNELEELKLQKKALMQKLLTGEVRVKV
ncbi:restriction endonuclease subunit S [Arcobacter porcinus]|uniref:Type-1 restriction enzyme EcoKI specificity protein n=1 Tax=Arcobacter porcinus TaxID=1935204 RepID=A0ABX2YAR8_9BACT|nr:restriction endonuclease subunit S [Arcobacter porcinus]OCL90830.1 Type-1 restriction enzyme EcoKI specificity protein [Arcobacter porcinus]